MSSSDWIIIPTIGENKNVPNHQHLRLLKLIPTYCAKNTFIHCTPSLRWLNLSKQSPSRNLQTMSTKRIWVNIWIDCTQKQRQICPQDVFFTCSNMAKIPRYPFPCITAIYPDYSVPLLPSGYST